MNHAGIAPIPGAVADTIRRFAGEALLYDAEVALEWERRAAATRQAFARLIGAQEDEIAFVRNTSEGLSLIAAGFPWEEGDNLIAVDGEYPANVYPWWGLQRHGVATRMVRQASLRLTVDDIAAAVDARTRLVAVSAVDWQSGFRTDLASVGELCHEHGLLFCVDGIQAVGALHVDVETAGIDCMAVGGHKWLLGPEGCGGLYVSRRVAERIEPVLLGWKSVRDAGRYLPYHFDLRPDASRFEAGSPAFLSIQALGAALRLLLELGPRAIEQRILEITAELREGLERVGVDVLSPAGDGERSGIVTFRHGDPQEMHQSLAERGISTAVRLDGIRLSPHCYNDRDDIARVLDAVAAAIR